MNHFDSATRNSNDIVYSFSVKSFPWNVAFKAVETQGSRLVAWLPVTAAVKMKEGGVSTWCQQKQKQVSVSFSVHVLLPETGHSLELQTDDYNSHLISD